MFWLAKQLFGVLLVWCGALTAIVLLVWIVRSIGEIWAGFRAPKTRFPKMY